MMVTPFLPTGPVPVYDVHHQNITPAVTEDTSPPSRKLNFNLLHNSVIDNTFTGFVVSVPLKQLSLLDTPSWAEIRFEWDILPGDFYDRVCARMDLDPKSTRLGYKFDVEAKKSIIHLPPNDSAAFNSMLEKVKSRIARSRTRAVILEIHNLVRPISPTYTLH